MLEDESEHEPNEIGHEAHRCANCNVNNAYAKLSEFDRFCLGWFSIHVSRFTMEANILGELMKGLGLSKAGLELFLLKMGVIYEIKTRPKKEN